MIAVYVVGGVMVWAGVAFGLACLFKPDEGNRGDAQFTAWVTTLWPITGPIIIACAIPFVLIWAMVTLGTRYVDFLAGEKNVVVSDTASSDRLPRYGVHQRTHLRPEHPRAAI